MKEDKANILYNKTVKVQYVNPYLNKKYVESDWLLP